MIPIQTGRLTHKIQDMIEPVDTLIKSLEELENRFEALIHSAPAASDFVAVDHFFHELRDIQFICIQYNAEFKAVTPVFHLEAIKQVDDNLWKKVKNSTTNTTKLCEAYAATLVRAVTKTESILKMIESTSIQYNTLISAIKKGL